MKPKNNMIAQKPFLMGLAVLLSLTMINQHFTSVALATEKDDPWPDSFTMDYLNPFDLTVTSYSLTRSAVAEPGSFSPSANPLLTTEKTETASPSNIEPTTTVYLRPPMVWIPYKPAFRSPCQPTWTW